MNTQQIKELLSQANQARKSLIPSDTNAYRLLDGEQFSQVEIDVYDQSWIVQTKGDLLTESWREALASVDKTVYWKHLSQTQKESPHYCAGESYEAPFIVEENGVRFIIRFDAGYSQGIFLDQRLNRLEVISRIKAKTSTGKPQRILNTFAYTGGFSVCAATEGAVTTTLDLSQPYLDWAKENFKANDMEPEEHFFCKGDTFHWLKRFAKKGRQFEGIILDPPTFSRTKEGQVFSVQKNYGELVSLAMECLSEDGWLLCCTNCRQLSERDFLTQIKANVPHRFKVKSVGMPPEYTGEPYLKSVWVN